MLIVYDSETLSRLKLLYKCLYHRDIPSEKDLDRRLTDKLRSLIEEFIEIGLCEKIELVELLENFLEEIKENANGMLVNDFYFDHVDSVYIETQGDSNVYSKRLRSKDKS